MSSRRTEQAVAEAVPLRGGASAGAGTGSAEPLAGELRRDQLSEEAILSLATGRGGAAA